MAAPARPYWTGHLKLSLVTIAVRLYTATSERDRVRFHLVHIPPSQPPPKVDVVLHGHTHIPRDEMKEGVRFLNPGCVTRPSRGSLPSVATLEINADGTLHWSLTRV
jgi:predicted phosphodiesterase